MSDASFLQSCRACSHEFRAAARYVGRAVACPTCRLPVTISDAKPVADKLIGRSIGGCVLSKRLGAGALGVVYEAQRSSDRAAVAIKLLSSQAAQMPDVVSRFQREAALAQDIRHPHVVAVHDCGHDRGVHYLVMDLIAGGSLAARIDGQPMPWAEAVALITPIADAVAALHARSIIHRDIKPANILIADDGRPLLADLGLAKDLDAGGDANSLTMSNVALGSPAYMPPEQIRDARGVGPAADVYALGATLFEAVTGVLPFVGRNGAEVMARVLRDAVPDPLLHVPDLPRGVVALLRSCLAKEAAQRPPDAQSLAAALRAVAADPTTPPAQIPQSAKARRSATSAGHPAQATGGGGIPWWVWPIALLIVGGGGVGAWYVLTHL